MSSLPSHGATSREDAILKWLNFYEMAGLSERESATWSLRRVAWRAGELKIAAASESLTRLLFVHSEESGTLIWALGRCGDASNASTLELHVNASGYEGRMAREGLRRVLEGEARERFMSSQREKFPFALRKLLDEGDETALLEALLTGRSDRELPRLYLEEADWIQRALRTYVQRAEHTQRVHEALNQLYQAAAFRGDAAMFASVAHRLERAPVDAALKRWLRRRTRRTLRRASQDDPEVYATLRTAVLERFSEAGSTGRSGLVTWLKSHEPTAGQ